MKIVHITPDLNFATRFVMPLAEYQSDVGNALYIITHCNEYNDGLGGLNVKALSSKKVEVIQYNVKLKNVNPLSLILGLLRTIRSINPDRIICHTSIDSFVPIVALRLLTRVPIVYYNHGVPFVGYKFLLKWAMMLMEISNVRLSHRTLTVSRGMERILARLPGRSSKISVVSPGSACGIEMKYRRFSDLAAVRASARVQLGFAPTERVVLYVGRFTKRKGVLDLIEAWKSIERTNEFKLIIVGSVNKRLLRRIKSLPSSIILAGYQSDLERYYLAADALCVPSHHEGFGYVYLEAASLGCVPMCSDIPGPTDFVKNDITGLVCDVGNVHKIAQALLEILTNEELRHRLAENAFNEAKKYDRQILVPLVVGALEPVCTPNDLLD